MKISIGVEEFRDLSDYFTRMPDIATDAARMAVNFAAARSAVPLGRDEMYEQVAFPRGYLGTARFGMTKKARNTDLEAIVTARDRPTSLARFVKGARPGQRGVMVEVHRGHSKEMKKGFIVKLRSGAGMDGKTFNLGLAIRLAPGEKLMNKSLPVEVYAKSLGPNVVLLYGPSVDQVFRSVSNDIQPQVAEAMETEFFRQLSRLSNG